MYLTYSAAASYYAATTGDLKAPRRYPLEGTTSADVVVIGGGICGCSAALHLTKRGYKVALLEARFVGYGASGRSGGQTIFGLAATQQSLKAQVGKDEARRLFDLSIEALDCTQALIERYGIDCDYRLNHVHVGTKPRHLQELADWARELHEDYEYTSARLLDRDELQHHLKSPLYLGGLIDTRSGHLHPLKYTQGVARAAELEGATLYEESQVVRYESTAAGVTVHTAQGNVRCQYLVLCGNAYLGDIAPALERRILGVGTYIIASEQLPEAQALSLMPSRAAIADLNWILDYFRLSADNRVLFGGRVSYSAREPRQLAQSMRKRLVRVFPELADLKVAYSWGGYLDITMTRAPDFGRLAPNVFYCQGFSGHGMSLTGLAGQLVAEAISGTAERFDVFARIPHRDFPGGRWLRRPSLVAAMLYYRLRDALP